MALVLFYHRVGPFSGGQPRKLNVEPGVFRAQVDAVARRYRMTSLDGLVGVDGRDLAGITFDDGYRDAIEFGLPVLAERRIPATMFVVAGAVGGQDTWSEHPCPIAEWADLKRWTAAGMQIGSHGMTHRRLDTLPIKEALHEVVESKRLLEDRLGVPVRHFSYPQGGRTPEIVAAVREAGYRAGWGTTSAPDDPFIRRRIRVSANDRGFRFTLKLWKIRWGMY